MYTNIKIELVKKHWTLVDLAAAIGMRYQTLSEKMRGNSPFTLQEAIAIKQALGSDEPLEYLFAVNSE